MNKLQTQFDVSSLMVSDNTIQFDVHGFFDIKYAGNKTFQIEAEFSSTKSHLSPVIDMDRTSVHTIQNRIGNTGSAASGELVARGGSEIARYITKKIELAEEADVANVFLNAHRPTGSDVLLYYRALDTGSSGSIFDEPFILATTTPETSADGKVPINDTGFEEVEYVLDDSKFRSNPQPFELTNTIDPLATDLVIRQKDSDVYLKPENYTHKPFPTKYESIPYLPTAGYVDPSDVKFIVAKYDDLLILNPLKNIWPENIIDIAVYSKYIHGFKSMIA